MKPIIEIKDFKGGMTLNEKLGGKDQFHIGRHLDFTSRPGFLTIRPGFTRMQLSSSVDVGQPMQGILYANEDANFYFGADNGTIYYQSTSGDISSAHASSQTGAIRGLVEYKGYMYYPQNTTIGRSDLAGSPTYTDNWQTGLTNVTFHPMKISADNKLYIGDDRYVASWDGSSYTAQALDIQDDWEIQCLADFGVPYLAIGANKKATSAGYSQGCKVILWSRANSTVWDDEIDIPEKNIYAMIDKGGYLWVFAGSNTLSIYVIPIGGRTPTKVFTFENDNLKDYTIKTYPNAVSFKEGRIYFGVSTNTSASTNSVPAVYSMDINPTKIKLNIEIDTTALYSHTGQIDIKCVAVLNSSENSGALYVSFDNGANENLVRENLFSGDTQFSYAVSPAGVYETTWFEAPPGKKIYIGGFGLDMLRRITSSGSLMISYKADGDTSYTDIAGVDYQENNGVGFFKKLARECYRIKLRIGITGSSINDRPYISRLYVRGQLQDDARITY